MKEMRRYEVWPGGDGQSNKAENSGDGEISNGAQYVTPVKCVAEKLKCACSV
jgi:hypothetical protein